MKGGYNPLNNVYKPLNESKLFIKNNPSNMRVDDIRGKGF